MKLSDHDHCELKGLITKDRDTQREPLSELIHNLNLSCDEHALKKEIDE
jgi:hypothetical protein